MTIDDALLADYLRDALASARPSNFYRRATEGWTNEALDRKYPVGGRALRVSYRERLAQEDERHKLHAEAVAYLETLIGRRA